MFGRKKNLASDERLDRIGRSIVRASTSSEAEAEAAASSPFLYERVRARIRAEQERLEGAERWLAMLAVVRRAVPAMGMIALLAFFSFLMAVSNPSTSIGFSVEAFFSPGDAEFARVTFADRGGLTNDEVLSAVIDDEQEPAK